MDNQNNQDIYYFILYPRYIYPHQRLQVTLDSPTFSIILFKGNHKQDEIVTPASLATANQREAYQLLNNRLQFKESLKRKKWELIKIQILREYELVGMLYMSTKEYIRRFQQDQQNYYQQTVKISKDYQLEFQLFISTNLSQLNNLYENYHTLSSVKTPYTKYSEIVGDKYADVDDLYEKKIIQSQIMMPITSRQRLMNDITQESEEQQQQRQQMSGVSSAKSNFKIDLKQLLLHSSVNKDVSVNVYMRDVVSWLDILKIGVFGVISMVMIYISMTPIKKI